MKKKTQAHCHNTNENTSHVALHFNFKKIFKALNFQACFHAEEMILFV
jgi:hypothetical protein